MKVWIARSIFDYEGAYFLGAFGTKEKAMKACEKDHKDVLDFKQIDKRNAYGADVYTDMRYSVFESVIR